MQSHSRDADRSYKSGYTRRYRYSLIHGSVPHRAFACLASTLLVFSLTACSKPDTPEQRIRALIANAERAAEKKEISALRGYLSRNYADEAGRDWRTIHGILRLYLLRHEAIHLFTRIAAVDFPEPARAEAVVYVAMAGRPIVSAEELAGFRANLYRFELRLAEEGGDWRVTAAAWRPAEPADFIR